MKQLVRASIVYFAGAMTSASASVAVPPPIPEADSYVLLALGVGLVVLLARKR